MIAVAVLLALAAGTANSATRDIYPDPAQAKSDLAAALKIAAATHKRVLLDFGGNWCGDCQVLDIYFHDPANRPILDANFVLVHINIGRMDANLDLAKKYGVPLEKGVPALAVLSEKGTLLYSQKGGEFEAMRRMQSSAVTSFLVQWRAGAARLLRDGGELLSEGKVRMKFDLEKAPRSHAYKLLVGLVAPRPIALITSMDEEGRLNAAPFSAYNYLCTDPPIIGVGVTNRSNESLCPRIRRGTSGAPASSW